MEYLPEELLDMIFSYLDIKSLIYLKRISKYFFLNFIIRFSNI